MTTTNRPLNILLVEDQESHVELIRRSFKSQNENVIVSVAHNLQEARGILKQIEPDIAIIDQRVPDGKGIQLLQKKQKVNCPAIIITSHGDEDLAVQAMKMGALDYVVKSTEAFKGLPRKVDRVLREWDHIQGRKEVEIRLRKQYSELIKTNSELDKFVYSASHDLRAPLSSVLGLINIARLETDDQQQINYLGMMEGSIRKLNGFIDDVINYSRNSRLEIRKEKIDFSSLISETVENYKHIEGFDKIALRFDLNASKPLFSDRERLQIIYNNLLSNSIKYRDPSQQHPFIFTKVGVLENKSILQVTDNGQGIAKKYLDNIFKMFYRASEDSVGSGLGLYIAKEAASKIHGEIFVESKPGIGSTFTVEIPH